MKYFLRVLVVLLIAGAVIFGVSYNYRSKSNAEKIELTTAPITQRRETTSLSKRLVSENKESGFEIYYDGKAAYLTNEKLNYEKKFESWGWAVEIEPPKMVYKDFDKDGKKELLIKILCDYDKVQKTNIYDIIIFEPITLENGTSDYNMLYASVNTWKNIFSSAVKVEVTQLKECKKMLQVVMDSPETSISYNSKTGISDNKHVAFAKAFSNNRGEYLKLEKWQRGSGVYDVDKNGNITLDVQVIAYYQNEEINQYIGDIHADIGFDGERYYIKSNSVYFKPKKELEVNDPRKTASSKWSHTITNIGYASPSSEESIDWIDTEFVLGEGVNKEKLDFSYKISRIKQVDKVKFTQKSVTLTAKEGFAFSHNILARGEFSVVINDGKEEKDNIAYKCEIKTVDKKSVLVITFDKTYDKKDLNKVTVKFGA